MVSTLPSIAAGVGLVSNSYRPFASIAAPTVAHRHEGAKGITIMNIINNQEYPVKGKFTVIARDYPPTLSRRPSVCVLEISGERYAFGRKVRSAPGSVVVGDWSSIPLAESDLKWLASVPTAQVSGNGKFCPIIL